ncbi:hypothetical protein SDC9_50576 [bioreactor metagenome]|uniref:BppU N-terminal domain-containing protein n=1 Tax=bioreactor metagenome TaxID=1076179 RepID=A0A644WKJ8_9ZZZZ
MYLSIGDYQLPEYSMTAGETQNITIMLFTQNKQQLDADGMTARLAISDYINRNSEPFIIKTCSITQQAGYEISSLFCKLLPADTITLRGKFIYQVTITDVDDTVAILKGVMNIGANVDQSAIS